MDPWEKARDEYLTGLSDTEKKLFQSASMGNVLDEVTRAEKAHRERSKSRAFSQKIQPLISAIDQYGKALDVLASSKSEILGPIWGSLRVLLHISQEYQKYFVKLLDMLERIGDILPRYNTFTLLFKDHPPVQNALSAVYLDIITFCMDAKKVFMSSSKSRVPSVGLRVISKLVWKPFDEQFGDVLDKFRIHRKLVEDEARLADMVESARERTSAVEERVKTSRERVLANKGREVVKRIEESVDMRDMQDMMTAIKNWIAAEFCDEEFERLQENRLEGTCEWILQKAEFQKWASTNDVNSQILWVYGIPGSGKTFIFTRLLEYLKSKAVPVAFFLCDNKDERWNKTSFVLRSWVFQLLKLFPNTVAIVDRFRNQNEGRPATQKDIMKLLLEMFEIMTPCYLALDALDECNDRKDFFQFIKRIPYRHKIMVVSREQSDIIGLMSAFLTRVARIKIAPQDIIHDIDSYISERLEVDFYMQEEDLNTAIRKRLLDCQGMFLWVRLMFDHLLMQTTIEELTDALDELPTGLDETYDNVLKKVNSLPSAQRLLAKKIFMWVVTVHRPLTMAELRTAVAIRPGDEHLDQKRLMINPHTTILALCAPLIEVKEPGNVVNTIHFTVNQYLLRYLEENRILPEITTHYGVDDLESAESLITAICMSYLAFSTIGELQPPSNCVEATALTTDSAPVMSFLSYASLYWFQHLKRTSYADPALSQLVRTFLNPQKKNLHFWWCTFWFSGPDANESRVCPSRFSPFHIVAYLGLEKVVQTLNNENFKTLLDSHGRTPLWWAVSKGSLPTTKALLEYGFDPNAPDSDLITPIHRAATNGSTHILSSLLEYHQKLSTDTCSQDVGSLADIEGWTPMHWAASRGNADIVEMIVRSRIVNTHISLTKNGHTPLHLAALNGHYSVIRCLTSLQPLRDNIIDIKDHNGLTALHLAAKQGHLYSVELLIRQGADVQIFDVAGKTAAQYARIMGHDKVETLLSLRQQKCLAATDKTISRKDARLKLGRTIVEHTLDLALRGGSDFPVPNSRDSLDDSALSHCINGHKRTLIVLFGKGRRFTLIDDKGRTMIHHSAAGGVEGIVKQLLVRLGQSNEGIDFWVNKLDVNDWTALHYAAANGFSNIVGLLLEAGGCPKKLNNKGKTPLDIAIEEGYRGVSEQLAKAPAFSTEELATTFQWTQLHIDARNGNLPAVERAIQGGGDISPKDRFGLTPLARAADMGKLDVVEALRNAIPLQSIENSWDFIGLAVGSGHDKVVEFLLRGLLPDSLDNDKARTQSRSLLFWAASHGNLPISRYLHELGVDMSLPDDSDEMNTVLHIAVKEGHLGLAEFFIVHGANVSALNAKGRTALHIAVTSNRPEAITLLLKHGADINSQVSDLGAICGGGIGGGRTPLRCAAEDMNLNLIEILLLNGADATISDDHGETPFSIIFPEFKWHRDNYKPGDPEPVSERILKVFKQYQPQLFKSISEEFKTPLHIAAAEGDIQTVRLLLEDGSIPVDTKDSSRHTALYYAVQGGHAGVVRMLLNFQASIGLDGWGPGLLVSVAEGNGHDEVLELLLGDQREEDLS